MNYFADQYAPMNAIDPASDESIRQWLQDSKPYYHREVGGLLRHATDASVLDVGCGIGGLMDYLISRKYSNVLGIDQSVDQLAVCKKFVSTNVIRKEAIQFLRRQPNKFDLILAFDVLEHIPKNRVLDFLRFSHRALRKGGQILLRTPNAAHLLGSYFRYIDFTHEVAFTPQSLRQVMLEAGLKNVVVQNAYIGRRRLFALRNISRLLGWLYSTEFPEVVTSNLIAVGEKK